MTAQAQLPLQARTEMSLNYKYNGKVGCVSGCTSTIVCDSGDAVTETVALLCMTCNAFCLFNVSNACVIYYVEFCFLMHEISYVFFGYLFIGLKSFGNMANT